MTADDRIANLEAAVRSQGLELLKTRLELNFYKALIATRRWGSPGGNDKAIEALDAAGYSVWGRVEKDSMNTKWAIDATRPVEAPFAELATVPEHVWREMDLGQYIRGWKR